MTTRLTGYKGNTIDVNDTYILAAVDSQSKWTKVVISLTRNAAYDGSILLGARPVGSSAAFVTQAYITKAGALSSAALGAASDEIEVDATGKELALISTGRTVGSMTVDTFVQNEA